MKSTLVIIMFLLVIGSCSQQNKQPIADTIDNLTAADPYIIDTAIIDLFDELNLSGIFIIYDEKNDKYYLNSKDRLHEMYCPASTFKIYNTLIGLETDAIADENYSLPWDGQKRFYDAWNKDHNLSSAFQNSVVWYYQEVARRIGPERMQNYLDSIEYGNCNTGDDVTSFWLDGTLKISPQGQLELLKKLLHNKMPFAQRNVDILKKISVIDSNAHYIWRGKTGTSTVDSVAWLCGWVETPDNHYYYVLNYSFNDFKNNEQMKLRYELPKEIFIIKEIIK